MERSSNRVLPGIGAAVALVAVLLLPGLAAGSSVRLVEKRMTVTGTIRVVDTNFFGTPTAVKIVSPEMGIYIIADDDNGRALASHVGETVTVVAVLKRNGKGQQYLHVRRFELDDS